MTLLFILKIFATLPWVAWHGRWVVVLLAILMVEILLTMSDFVVEKTVRKPLGDVYAGERVTHALMGIIYGAVLAYLLPVLSAWWAQPTVLVITLPSVPGVLRWSLTMMAVGVSLSGVRDLYAAFGLPYGGWPWSLSRFSTLKAKL